MEALLAFKSAVDNGKSDFQLLNIEKQPVSLKDATIVKINASGQEFQLDMRTAFESTNPELGFIDLRSIINCWQCKDLSVPQYIATSDELGIPNLKFLERTDLIEWLEGANSESEYIKHNQESTASPLSIEDRGDVEMKDADSSTLLYADVDRGVLIDHATILRGEKINDFHNVASLCHKNIVSEYRQAGSGRPVSSHSQHSVSRDQAAGRKSNIAPLKPQKGKDPIILLSPSPSSLLNMANVQSFLENGVYSPTLKSANSPNLLRITRNSKIIGPRTKFVVVDSVDQFKPDYWDRVVAVFVTGQSWQLRSYKWQDANTLFHHVLGFGLVYKNDPVPELLKQWNVKIEPLDRTARFRDREVVERIWERIEAHMVARGWPLANTS